jgi:hypothetical protein
MANLPMETREALNPCRHLISCVGRPADVAETRRFLLSPKSPRVTGTIGEVDGSVRAGHNRYTARRRFHPVGEMRRLTVKMLLSDVGPNPVLYLFKIRIRYQRAIRVRDTRDQKGDLLFHVPPIE